MGNWRTGDPEESGSFLDDFVEWMDTPEGQQSIEAHDLVFDALENAGVDPRQRKIVWDDGQRLSIEQSAERIHAWHRDTRYDQIEIHVVGWLETTRPSSIRRAGSGWGSRWMVRNECRKCLTDSSTTLA